MALALSGIALAGSLDPSYTAARTLGRGVNLGNMLEAPREGEWGIRLQSELFARAKEAGFNTVRLPVRWSNHAEPVSPYRIDEAFFKRVDFAIREATRHGLNIVVDMHHYRQLDGDPLDEGEQAVDEKVVDERFVAMWRQIAERYRSQPVQTLFFELYNEPHNRLTAEAWNRLVVDALDAIRASSPDRFIIVGPAGHNRVDQLRSLSLPITDRHIIVTVHLYEPYTFTHQGAPWVQGSSKWLNTSCCSDAQRREIARALDSAQLWARWQFRPLWVGEFGSNDKADYDSRVRYTRIAREELEARGMSWAYWQLASNFGLFQLEHGTWYTALMEALLGPRKTGDVAGR